MYFRYGKMKRIIDLIISVSIFLAMSPLLIILTLFLFIFYSGNPFFFQIRPGKNGKLFKIIKFKTMNNRKGDDETLLPDFKRLTRVGKIIRSLSLDELPQLINIIKGDMSLVGPRPLLEEYLPLYNEQQKKRHLVRPGITGWAQVNGRNSITWNEKFNLDIWYVENISFIIDVADRIKKCTNIIFLLIGEGTEKEKIKNLIKIKKLNNVILIDLIPQDDYINLTKQCDVGLVNLSEKFTIPNIPCRTLSYWKSQLPVLAAIDKNTDYGDLLDRCNGGLWSITGNTDAYIANLLTLYNNPEKKKQMGENGYNFLINELNSEKAYKTIISKI